MSTESTVQTDVSKVETAIKADVTKVEADVKQAVAPIQTDESKLTRTQLAWVAAGIGLVVGIILGHLL